MQTLTVIYVLWLRELKKFFRAPSRIVGTVAMPFFFLAFLKFGFGGMRVAAMSNIETDANYLSFVVPGIIGMTMLFSSMFSGISVLWDREFGFLKEIMVAPVSRIAIVLGRIAGGMTISLFQGIVILALSFVLGFRVSNPFVIFGALLFMVLIAFTFIGLGLSIASRMKDFQGFQLIMNFVIFPIFFLSGALFPIDNFPLPVRILSYIDPLTYGVDGLRMMLAGAETASFSFIMNAGIMIGASIVMVILGAILFETSEYV